MSSVSRSFSIPVGHVASYAVDRLDPSVKRVQVVGGFSAPVWLGWLDTFAMAALEAGLPFTPIRADVGEAFDVEVRLPHVRTLHLVAWNREGFVPVTGTLTLTFLDR
jgi:hypothetical protein